MAKVALITGAARRVGAMIARFLHAKGMNVIIHYHHSAMEAEELSAELNAIRPNSAKTAAFNLLQTQELAEFMTAVVDVWGKIDILINNASTFYPSPMGNIDESTWHDLIGSNLKAPLFLAQAAAPYLAKQQGNIINIIDVHAWLPLKQHAVYCVAKAGLAMLTRSLAIEFAPTVRVNGVAPGAIMWPDKIENQFSEDEKQVIVSTTPLQRIGGPEDIARAVWFFVDQADFITGQVLAVDGGRSINF